MLSICSIIEIIPVLVFDSEKREVFAIYIHEKRSKGWVLVVCPLLVEGCSGFTPAWRQRPHPLYPPKFA
jgi:hypothetical protein